MDIVTQIEGMGLPLGLNQDNWSILAGLVDRVAVAHGDGSGGETA